MRNVKKIECVKLPIVQKLKLLGNGEINHLTIILITPPPPPSLMCLNFPLINGSPTRGILNILNGRQSKGKDRTNDLLL